MKTTNRLITTFLLFVALSGCAVKNIQPNFSFKDEPQNGVVVFSISHDMIGGKTSQAIFYLDGGLSNGGNALISLDEAPFPWVSRSSEFVDSYGRLFVLALPAGKHVFNSWQITNGTGLRIFPKEKPTPLTFEVISGQAKYLGNLHGNLQVGKNIFGMTITGSGYPEIFDRQKRDIPLFENKYPQFKGKIAVDLFQLGPWIKTTE